MKFKKKLAGFLIIILCLSINTSKMAHAQDSLLNTDSTSEGTDWDSLEQRETKYQMNKVVTPQQFDQAMKTMQKPEKKDKKGKSSRVPREQEVPQTPASTSPLLRLPVDVVYGDVVIKEGFYLVDVVRRDDKQFLVLKQGYSCVAEIEAKENNQAVRPKDDTEETHHIVPSGNDFEDFLYKGDNSEDAPPPKQVNKRHSKVDSQSIENGNYRKHGQNNSQNYASMKKINSEIVNDKIKIDYFDKDFVLEAILPIAKQE